MSSPPREDAAVQPPGRAARLGSRWIWLGSIVAVAGALASITPAAGLPYLEDFESTLAGWTQELDTGNQLSLDLTGRAWSGRSALAVQAAPSLGNAALSAPLGGSQTLAVRFFLHVSSAAAGAIAPGAGAVRLVRADDQLPGRVTLDLLRGADNQLYLFPAFAGVSPLPLGNPVTSITPEVYHYVELDVDAAGTVSLYIDDPRVPRFSFGGGGPSTFSTVAVGIAGRIISTGTLELLYDDLAISNRHVGLTAAKLLVANEYDSPGLIATDYPAGKGQAVEDSGVPPPDLVSQTTDLHRGKRGMNVTDRDINATIQGAAVYGYLDRDAPTPVYRRVWWRWVSRTNTATHTVLAIGDSRGQDKLAARIPAAVMIQDDGAARLWGVDDTGQPAYGPASVPLAIQPWHLLELYAAGFGTDAGERRAWANGIPLGRLPAAFNLTSADQWIDGVLAPVTLDGRYAGSDSFDDARTSTWIQPSRFELRLSTTNPGCDLYDLVALTSDGVVAPVPETATVALDAGVTGTFHAQDCAGNPPPVPSATVAGGTTSSVVWFRPNGNGLLLRTTSADYLPWEVSVPAPDAGPSGPAVSLAIWGLPKVVAQGQGSLFAVEARDDGGAPATGYARRVTVNAGGATVIPGAHDFNALDQGYFVFVPGVSFPSPGVIAVTANDGALTATVPVQVIGSGQLAIVDDANREAVAGAPYVYNSFGAVTAVSTAGSLQFHTCDSPPAGFNVEQDTGAVRWTPAAAGPAPICLKASASSTPDFFYRYTVTVAPAVPGPPDAGFVVRPSPAVPGAFVVADPRGSRSQVGPPIFRWRFGDGAWPSADPKPFHRYPLPGGYRPHLTVRDGAGQSATADQPLQVGALTRLPPAVRIASAQPLRERNALAATLSAEVTLGTSPALVAYRWDLGDGTSRSGTLAPGEAVPDATASYGPGRYFAQLLVVDGNGLTATDKAEVVVSRDDQQPPDCLATIEPTAVFLSAGGGRAGFRAFQLQGTAQLKDATWIVDGQSTSGPLVVQTYDAGGWHDGALTVLDEAGLLCRDRVELPVIPSASTFSMPPRIVDPGGGAAACGQPLDAGAPVVADPAGLGVSWSLAAAPAGGTMDDAGRVSWTPPSGSSAPGTFVLVATSSAGTDQATVTVPVDCPDSRSLGTRCGCGAGSGAPLMALALAALRLLAARRGRSTGSTASRRRPAAPPR